MEAAVADMAERSFSESWILLGAVVELAMQIVEAQPDELISLLTTARQGIGTQGERSLLAVMTAMRDGALAQVRVANQAISAIETIARHADESALAGLTAGPAH
jgi:hypothetical protein